MQNQNSDRPACKTLAVMESDRPLSERLSKMHLEAMPLDMLRGSLEPKTANAVSRSVINGIKIRKEVDVIDKYDDQVNSLNKQAQQEPNYKTENLKLQLAQARVQALEAELAAINGN